MTLDRAIELNTIVLIIILALRFLRVKLVSKWYVYSLKALYGLCLVVLRAINGVISLVSRVRHSLSQVQPPRPKVATRVSELASVHKMGLTEVIVGYNGKRPIKMDIRAGHTLIGSSTGQGKSNMVNKMLVQLFSRGSVFTDKYDVYLIDLKDEPQDNFRLWQPLLAGYYPHTYGTIRPAIDVLESLLETAFKGDKEVILIVEEMATLIDEAADRQERGEALAALTALVRKVRTRGSVIITVQNPHHTVVPTVMRFNLMQRIYFGGAEEQQAVTTLGFRPEGRHLPRNKGDFIFRSADWGLKQYVVGRSMLVDTQDIIDVVERNVSSNLEADDRVKLYKSVCSSLLPGTDIPGVNKIAGGSQYSQKWVQDWARNMQESGVFVPNGNRGRKMGMSYQEGLSFLVQFINAGKWQSAPDPQFEE